MKTYRIPNTDLDATRIAYGTMNLGDTWDSAPLTADIRERASRVIHTAVEQGINFFDFADIYGRGKSDTVVGEVFAAQPSLRQQIIVQEKCGIILAEEKQPGEPGRYDFSYQHLVEALEGCLRRLQTDYVDILLLHRPDALVEPEEVARAFDDLQAAGKVRYFGVSNHRPGQIDLLKKYVRQPLVANQLEVNLLHHHLINDGLVVNTEQVRYTAAEETLDYCRLHDMIVQAWSPVAVGKLFNPPLLAPANVKAVAQEIETLAEQYQTTKEAIALAWLLRHPARIQPIIGTVKPERVVDSCHADDIELTRVEWYRLLTAAKGASVP